jgi:hypothetical protein
MKMNKLILFEEWWKSKMMKKFSPFIVGKNMKLPKDYIVTLPKA